jgi:hypothetical protein
VHAFAHLTVPEIEYGLLAVIVLGTSAVAFFVVFSMVRAMLRAIVRTLRRLAPSRARGRLAVTAAAVQRAR